MAGPAVDDPLARLCGPVRDWFRDRFPGGPTPAQRLAWPAIAGDRHALLVSPTGTGKTLAAFLAILDRLFREYLDAGKVEPGLRCVYLSPLRSLGYDIERNLTTPLAEIARRMGLEESPVTIGVRTGDTSAWHRKKLKDSPPHLLITTPESLSLLLSQADWGPRWKRVGHLIVDEIHSLAPTKRGADLMVSLERLASQCASDPCRVGLSATCRPAETVAQFLVGPTRSCDTLEASPPEGARPTSIEVETLIQPDEGPHRGLSYRRLLKRLEAVTKENRTTVIFANTRAFTEKITHDLRQGDSALADAVAAHHSALDADRRRQVESDLKEGKLRAVVTSTSLELGVDIGQADLSVLVGLPGSVSRCLQRVGRAGHSVGAQTRGLLLAATHGELVGAAVTAKASVEGRVEPIRPIKAPLDVLCQQLIGMAAAGECSVDASFERIRKASPFRDLERADYDACLNFLAGTLASPAGAFEPEPGAAPKWTAPRIWMHQGLFGIRSARVSRWFRSNVGTITSEESAKVLVDGKPLGTLEGAYAERLQAGDTFVLDGRTLEFRRLEGLTVHARPASGEPNLPRWSSDRQGLSNELAREVYHFRRECADRLADGPQALRAWLVETYDLGTDESAVVGDLIAWQERLSEVPGHGQFLVEETPGDPERGEGYRYSFHAPLGRAGCEAMGRATAARVGKQMTRDLQLGVADLGWCLTLPEGYRLKADDLSILMNCEGLEDDILVGLDRGDLLARRFRHVAATGLMVLRNPEGGRTRVGGLLWVSRRLYPLVKAACPSHPLLKETRREVLHDLLDTRSALDWLATRPVPRFRPLNAASPFAMAWIDPAATESVQFESAAEALKRLHRRLVQP